MFLIDTGASGTVLDGPTLPVATRRTMRRVRGRVRGALGTADVDRRSLSSSLTSDGWTSRRLRTTVLPLSGIGAPLGLSLGGVLGLDLLARGAFAVDLDRMVLSLFPDRTAPEAAHRLHRHSIHRARRGLITLDVSVGGIIVRGVLDTGAGVSVVAPELAERAVGAAGRDPDGVAPPAGSVKAVPPCGPVCSRTSGSDRWSSRRCRRSSAASTSSHPHGTAAVRLRC